MTSIDFGRRSRDYATHRPGFPASFYERLETLVPFAGVRALDLATGPGVVALELAARGATVHGIDIAAGQIELAQERARARGLADRASFEVCRAEEFDSPDASLDLVTAGQCWHWLDHAVLLPRLRRMLRPGGTMVAANFDYIAHRSPIAKRTEDLILQYNPAWHLAGKIGLYPERIDQLIGGGFEFVEQVCYDHLQDFTHESWRGRIRTCNGVGSGGMTAEQVEEFDAALADLLRTEYPDEPLHIWHRVWMVVAQNPGGGA